MRILADRVTVASSAKRTGAERSNTTPSRPPSVSIHLYVACARTSYGLHIHEFPGQPLASLRFPFHAVRLRAKIPDRSYPKGLKTIGDHLRKRRLDLGLRQKDVGALVGAAKPTVAAWEHQGTRPEGDVLRRIVDFLGYEPESPRIQ